MAEKAGISTVHVDNSNNNIAPDPFSHRDAEKIQVQSSDDVQFVNFSDQIPHSMLEELAPNGEGDYILDKINNMTEEEALAIVSESHKFFADDWNFPTEMRSRMGRLLEGRKAYGEFYDRDLRIDAVMLRYSSPYPGVRAVADPVDDQNVPIETIRAYFLGISWAIMCVTEFPLFNVIADLLSRGVEGEVYAIRYSRTWT
jgi:hypothetical protein